MAGGKNSGGKGILIIWSSFLHRLVVVDGDSTAVVKKKKKKKKKAMLSCDIPTSVETILVNRSSTQVPKVLCFGHGRQRFSRCHGDAESKLRSVRMQTHLSKGAQNLQV